jgi:hypothetical protein
MSRERNTLADLLAKYSPPTYEPNAVYGAPFQATNSLYDWRTKTEYVPGYSRLVPNGLLGAQYEWVPGYWRRRAF